jgi:cytochrome c556
MKKLLLAALAAAATLPAAAQFKKPEDAVKYRHSAFTVMAVHFSSLGAMVNGRIPFDAAKAQSDADIVAMMAKLPFSAFGEGTDKPADSKAKAEVWTENDKFKEGATKLQEEAAKLQAVAKSGNADQIKAQFGATAKTCKACHDHFRKE